MSARPQPFGVGSLPWREPLRSVEHVRRYYASAPFVPQLPLRGTLSQMIVEPFQRYREHFDSARGGTIRKGALDALVALSTLSPRDRLEVAPRAGAVDFDESLEALGKRELLRCKLQLIGPATLFKHLLYGGRQLAIAGPEGNALYRLYLEELEYRISSAFAHTSEVSVVFDEPALPYLGRDELTTGLRQLERLGAMVRERGASFGIHCCGSLADPGVRSAVVALGADIFSTPCGTTSTAAVESDLSTLVRAGGTLALGVCPTDASITHLNPTVVAHRIRQIEARDATFAISATCGLGFSGEENADAVGRAIAQICELLAA